MRTNGVAFLKRNVFMKKDKNVSIDEFNELMQEKVELTFDQKEDIRLGRVQITIALILTELSDYLIREAESNLKRSGQCKGIRHDVKRDHRLLLNDLRNARVRVKDFSKIIYRLKDADSACQDSDDLLDLIRLYINRSACDREVGLKIRSMIKNSSFKDLKIMDRREEDNGNICDD